MKILPQHLTTPKAYFCPNFNARSKESKKADEIERITRANFPMLSPSYVEKFYISAGPDSKNQARAREITRKMWNISLQNRAIADGMRKLASLAGQNPYPLNDILWTKETKIGCCDESSDAALAVLYANDYFNASRSQLICEINFIDINTGESVFKTENSIKHCFVTVGFDKDTKVDMPVFESEDFSSEIPEDISVEDLSRIFGIKFINFDSKGSDQNFVIDPWLSFADYSHSAVSKYKQVFSDEIEVFQNSSILRFLEKLEEEGDENPDSLLENYKMAVTFKFKNISNQTLEEKRLIAKEMKKAYPEVILGKSECGGNLDINV